MSLSTVAEVWRLMKDGHDGAHLDDIAEQLVELLHEEYDLADIRYEFDGEASILNYINGKYYKNRQSDSWDDDDGDEYEMVDIDEGDDW